MITISVINYKGGVGKTRVTANLAAELAYRDNRLLAIDLDPQASLTFSFFSVDEWIDFTTKNLMKIKHFNDTDTALVVFTENAVKEIRAISENIYIDINEKSNKEVRGVLSKMW